MRVRFLVRAGAVVACFCWAPCARVGLEGPPDRRAHSGKTSHALADAGVRLAMILNDAAKTNP